MSLVNEKHSAQFSAAAMRNPHVSTLWRLLVLLMVVTGCITHKSQKGDRIKTLIDALKLHHDKAKEILEDVQTYYKGSMLQKAVQAAQKYRDKHMDDPLGPVLKKLASWSKSNGGGNYMSSVYELYKQFNKGNEKPNKQVDSEEIIPAERMATKTAQYKRNKLHSGRFMPPQPSFGDVNSKPTWMFQPRMEDPKMDGGIDGPKEPVPPPPPPPKKKKKEASGLASYDFGDGKVQNSGGQKHAGNKQKSPNNKGNCD